MYFGSCGSASDRSWQIIIHYLKSMQDKCEKRRVSLVLLLREDMGYFQFLFEAHTLDTLQGNIPVRVGKHATILQ